MGPKLQLSYNLMNMGDVFIGDRDCYEVRNVQPRKVVSLQKMLGHASNVGSLMCAVSD